MSSDPYLWKADAFIGPLSAEVWDAIDALALDLPRLDMRAEVEAVVRRSFSLGESLGEAIWRAACEWDL